MANAMSLARQDWRDFLVKSRKVEAGKLIVASDQHLRFGAGVRGVGVEDGIHAANLQKLSRFIET